MEILSDTGLTFDDVLLIPRKTDIRSRFNGEISLRSPLLPAIDLDLPIVSANMDTITNYQVTNIIQKMGGLGIIHRFLSIEEHRSQLNTVTGPKVACIGLGE